MSSCLLLLFATSVYSLEGFTNNSCWLDHTFKIFTLFSNLVIRFFLQINALVSVSIKISTSTRNLTKTIKSTERVREGGKERDWWERERFREIEIQRFIPIALHVKFIWYEFTFCTALSKDNKKLYLINYT